MRIDNRYLHRIAVDIDRYGASAVASDIAMILDLARDAGIASPAVEVLSDDTANEVVRTRALAVVITQLDRAATTSRPLAAAGVH